MMLLLLILSPVPKNFVCMYVCVLHVHFCLCVCAHVSMCVLVYVQLFMHMCVET